MTGLDVEYLLNLWGRLSREEGIRGYPSKVPWYTNSGYRSHGVDPSNEEMDLADRVGCLVRRIGEKYPERGEVGVVFYGASPEFRHTARKERVLLLKERGYVKSQVYREIDSLKKMVEGALMV